jgi:hypothetical protein
MQARNKDKKQEDIYIALLRFCKMNQVENRATRGDLTGLRAEQWVYARERFGNHGGAGDFAELEQHVGLLIVRHHVFFTTIAALEA